MSSLLEVASFFVDTLAQFVPVDLIFSKISSGKFWMLNF